MALYAIAIQEWGWQKIGLLRLCKYLIQKQQFPEVIVLYNIINVYSIFQSMLLYLKGQENPSNEVAYAETRGPNTEPWGTVHSESY